MGRGECEEGLGHFEGEGEERDLSLRLCELNVCRACVRQWLETFSVAKSMVAYTGVCLEASVLGKTAKPDERVSVVMHQTGIITIATSAITTRNATGIIITNLHAQPRDFV